MIIITITKKYDNANNNSNDSNSSNIDTSCMPNVAYISKFEHWRLKK